ncbi:MAG: hypothetical protein LBT20_05515 [Clostridiales bacterium]|jgi:hypothetical protein|nr:hypothetical protein [Clostridiales bacterium]
MDWSLGSAIGMYVGAVICLAFSYLFAGYIEGNKHNQYRKTIKLKYFKRLFWYDKKTIVGGIFIITFIHELLSIMLFIATTAMLVISILLKNELIIGVSTVTSTIYVCYCSVIERVAFKERDYGKKTEKDNLGKTNKKNKKRGE